MKVLVTGAGGFLGSAVAVACAPEHDVVALDRRVDLAHADAVRALARELRRVDAVVHCAAATPFNGGDLAGNDAITANVARLCDEVEAGRLLFASGWVVYAVDRLPVRETDRLAPATPYGASKLASERHFAAHLPHTAIVNLRLASLYGPGQLSPGLIPNLVGAGLAGRPLRIAAGRTRRDYLHVADAADAIRRLLAVAVADRLDLNLGGGGSASVLEVASTIGDILGLPVEVDEPPREGSPADNALDVSAARALGLLERPRSLRTGLADYVSWRLSRIMSA